MSIFRRITNLFCRARIDKDIDGELQTHLVLRIEDNLAAGMSKQEARRNAFLRFGNPVLIKERTSASDSALELTSLWFDIRYGLRRLRKAPVFSTITVLTLGESERRLQFSAP